MLLLGLLSAPSASAAPANLPGWTRDHFDDFNGPLNSTKWGIYETSDKQIEMLSSYARSNVYTQNGNLVLRTNKTSAGWRAAGVSGARGFWAAQGKWAVRAKFERAYGIGYAFLLMPKGGGWPPEVDIAEGTAGGPRVMSTLHWTSANLRASRDFRGLDMSEWHTYGVILSNDKVEFTIDGEVWSTLNNSGSPRVPMWLGFQTGAKGCAGSTGECVSSATPNESKIYIDWVAHYEKN